MKLLYGIAKELLHRIRVKLYPNYLPGFEGTYIARTDTDRTLDIEHICAAKISRAGFKIDPNIFVDCSKALMDESFYQLMNGRAINLGYVTAHPHVSGTFKSPHEKPNSKDHVLSIVFHPLKPLRDLAGECEIVNTGLADTDGYIDYFKDTDEDSENEKFAANNAFIIRGNKIMLAGTDSAIGVYFVGEESGTEVKVQRIIKNTANEIIGIVPDPTPQSTHNRIKIVTQFTGSSNKFLKEPRVIISPFILEEA